MARDNHEVQYKIFPKLRQAASIIGLSLTRENLQSEISSQCEGLRVAKGQMLEIN